MRFISVLVKAVYCVISRAMWLSVQHQLVPLYFLSSTVIDSYSLCVRGCVAAGVGGGVGCVDAYVCACVHGARVCVCMVCMCVGT